MQKTSEVLWQDQQHQQLFEILALMKQPGSGTEVLRRLEDYTAHHFALEEAYMRELDYPGREAHERAHARFREEIERAVADEPAPDALFMELMSTFLTEWLTRHVLGIDKELEAFLLQNERH